MTDIIAQTFVWDGEVMEPLDPKLADRQYVVGEKYRLIPHQDRSKSSHGHYFACVAEAYKNLPEDATERYPSAEHLRKWALVKAGYRNERAIACETTDQALKVTALAKALDEYAVVVLRENTVMIYTAKSQSTRSMGRENFQKSKEAVLDVLTKMIGTDPTTLSTSVKSNTK